MEGWYRRQYSTTSREPLWSPANFFIVSEDSKHSLCAKDYNGLDVKCLSKAHTFKPLVLQPVALFGVEDARALLEEVSHLWQDLRFHSPAPTSYFLPTSWL